MLIGFTITLVGLAAAAALVIFGLRNRIVRARNEVDYALGQVATQLQRRHDLIPNLVDTVRGLATHERELLEGVIKARHAALSTAAGTEARFAAELALGRRLVVLQGVAENYPSLRADAGFMRQMADLKETEDLIQRSRTYYNDSVRRFFDLVRQAPGRWLNRASDAATAPAYFAAEGGAAKAPRVAQLNRLG